MTKADFLLLTDAINEGIEAYLKDGVVMRGDMKPHSIGMEVRLRSHIAKCLANRLRYTSDSFDPTRFEHGIKSVSVVQ